MMLCMVDMAAQAFRQTSQVFTTCEVSHRAVSARSLLVGDLRFQRGYASFQVVVLGF